MKSTMFLRARKKGVTVAMLVTILLIISLMTTTITIAVVNTVKSSKLKAFATELSLVQDTIQELSFSGSVNEYLADDILLTLNSVEQFEGENIDNNTVLLHILDLPQIGIKKSIYGTGKLDKDYYAVSLDTMKVYYVAGYDSGDEIYYTLTEELIQLLSGNGKVTYTNSVVFKANTVEWTNKPINVIVRLPINIDVSTVTVEVDNDQINVSSFENKGSYNECTVNTENEMGNYVVTVKYMVGEDEKTETYSITNYDNEKPMLVLGSGVDSSTAYYLKVLNVYDNGRVKKLKYIDMDIAEDKVYNFFKDGGIDLIGDKIKLSTKNSKFTIYAEDYAGNYTTYAIKVPDGFYYVGGTKDTGLVISDNSEDETKGVAYKCKGNQFVWVPVDDYSQFVRAEVDKGYVEPYINGYDNEVEEYNAMCNSVKKYGGFYIARFEAGDADATEGTNDVTKEPRTGVTVEHKVVSKKEAYVYNYVTWGEAMNEIGENGAVYLSQNMYKDHTSVVSTLCYGVQWDAVMNFVSDEDHNVNDSRKWGNYKDSIEAAATNKGILQQTGTNEAWQAKNIYDLAGNVWEWTMEAGSSTSVNRIARSGAYCNNGSVCYAFNRNPLSYNYFQYYVGFRVALYLK